MNSSEIAELLKPLLLAFTESLARDGRGVPGRIEPVAFTTEESGMWRDWKEAHADGIPLPKGMYAIKFSDGTVFDLVNGWRPGMPEMPFTPKNSGRRASEAGEAALRNLAKPSTGDY